MKKSFLSCFLPSFFVSLVVFSFYCLWFAVLDRRLIFLYGHMHTTPFDVRTISRHWMTGLVAGGIVFVSYTILSLIAKKIRRQYQLPDWKTVWKYSCLILFLPLLVLLTFTGKPPMPVILSFWILVVLFSSLGLALYSVDFVVRDFWKSIWAFFDGLTLVPVLSFFPLYINYGLRLSRLEITLVAPVVMMVLSLLGLRIMTFFYKRLKKPYTLPLNIFLSGLTIVYLLLPLLHYIGSRPGYVRYITNGPNFFADSLFIQLLTFLVTFAVIAISNRWRNKKNLDATKKLLLYLLILTAGGYLITGVTTGKETDVWICHQDQWIKIGNPPYEKPFDEECGIIDKAMGL